MKKLLMLSMLFVFAITLAYAKSSDARISEKNNLINRLTTNTRLLTDFSHNNMVVNIMRKKQAHVIVMRHNLLNDLRLNARLLTVFLNTTLYGSLGQDSGTPNLVGESYRYDLDLDVDNNGMIHEIDSLVIPTTGLPSGFTLLETQIHVELDYNTSNSADHYPYTENTPGLYTTTLSYDYPADGLYYKRVDYDWGYTSDEVPDGFYPAWTVVVYY